MTKINDNQLVTYGMLKEVMRETEHNIAELISDLMIHIDKRFDRVERDIKILKKTVQRIDNHEIRIQALEAKSELTTC